MLCDVERVLRRHLIDAPNADQGHILQNLIYLELLRRNNEVYVGHLPNGEVDFIARNADGIAYYQSAATVLSKETLRRELSSLESIKDNHPKFLLTLDELGAGTIHNGIRQLNALDWMLTGGVGQK